MNYTVEDYWSCEANSEARYEYFDGEIIAVKRTGVSHNLLAINILMALRPIVKQCGYRVFKESVRLEVQESRQYAYPDIVLVCNPADRSDPYTVRQPTLLAEVLSPDTAEYDRTTKFKYYQKIPSLRHYILIS